MSRAAAPPAPPLNGPASRPIPAARFGALFSCALTVLCLLWLPITLLQQVDALLVFSTAVEVWRDVALLMLLALLPALLLALMGWLVQRTAMRTRRYRDASDRLAWALVLTPILWLFLWQFARASWLWLKLLTQHQFAITPQVRLAAIALLLLALAAVWRRWGSARAITSLLDRLHSLRLATLLILLASAVVLILDPPRVLVGDHRAHQSSAAASAGRPDIFVISLDALAAQDALACGSGPTNMPRLRQFAGQATCFSRMYSSSNFTTPSTSTIETGTLPWSHFATQISAKVAAPLQDHTLAQKLRDNGYQTLTATDNQLASPLHHGTYRGYDQKAISPSSLLRDKLRAVLTAIPDSSLPLLVDSALSFLGAFDSYLQGGINPFEAERVYTRVLAMLDRTSPDQPRFVWVHTMPPHSPYLPPPNSKYKLLPAGQLEQWHDFFEENIAYASATQPMVDKHRLRYRESIMGADASLGVFLEQLERRGLLKNAVIIVTADHGESFERGFLGHAGPLLHEALINIPLVVKLPGQTQGYVIDTPVSQADLAPTVLDLTRSTPLPQAEGRSLQPGLRSGVLEDAPVFSMSLERQSRFTPMSSGNFAVISGRYKLIKHLATDQRELYDLATDPREQNNIATTRADLTDRLDALIENQLRAAERRRKAWAGS